MDMLQKKLSPREKLVYDDLVEVCEKEKRIATSAEQGEKFGISPRTIESYVARIKMKLWVKKKISIVRKGIEE